MRLRSNILWMLVGNVLYMGGQWGVLVAAVKLGSPVMVGQFSYAFAVCAPVFLFAQLRLRSATATDARREFTPATYLTLRLLATFAALAFVGLLCIVCRFDSTTAKVVMAVAVAKAFESGSDVLYGISQQAERMRTIAFSMAARGVLALILFAFLLFKTHQLLYALAGFGLGWAIVFLVYDLPIALAHARQHGDGSLTPSFNWSAMRRLLWITFPLGLTAMTTSAALNLPRYCVEHFQGSRELGIFSALSYLTISGSVVVNSITEASAPRFARYMAVENGAAAKHLFSRLMWITGGISGAGVLGAALFGDPLLKLVYRQEYAVSASLIILMMMGAGMSSLASVCNYMLLAGRSMWPHLVSLCLLIGLMTIGCLYAIPRWGLMGAAVSTCMAFSLQLLWGWWSVVRSIASTTTTHESIAVSAGLATNLP